MENFNERIFIITENWQYSDKRVTRVVNDYVFALKDEYEVKVFHVTKVYTPVEKFFRRIFYIPLSLYNGMLPIDIFEDAFFSTDEFAFSKISRSNFSFRHVEFATKDKIIIHWLDTALYVLSNCGLGLLIKLDITVVVHELHPAKWLFIDDNVQILMNVRVLARNTKISTYLRDFGINSEVIRSFV